MDIKEAPIGFSSVGPSFGACPWHLARLCLEPLVGCNRFVCNLCHGQDGLDPSNVFAGHSAWILKRSQLDSAHLVLPLGLAQCIWFVCVWLSHGGLQQACMQSASWTRLTWSFPIFSPVIRHGYRRGPDWFQQCQLFQWGLSIIFAPILYIAHTRELQQACMQSASWTRWT
jgi:hypothetical protein